MWKTGNRASRCYIFFVCYVLRHAGPGQLADTGRQEQRDLGQRVVERYPELFESSPGVDFFTSSSSRAVDSQRSFELGLTQQLGRNISTSSSYDQRDDLLRYYDACPSYVTSIKQNRSTYRELDKFRLDTYPAIKRRIARRLDVEELTVSDGS